MGGVWGWRGILGQIAPSVFAMFGEYFYRVVPEGVALMTVTLGVNEPSSGAEVERALADVERAARQLGQAKPDFICLSGEPLILSQGQGFDKKIIKRIEDITQIRATTSLTSVIEALHALSVRKLVIATPSTPELNQRKKEYLEACGFKVLNISGPVVPKNSDKRKLPMHVPYVEAKKAYLEAPEEADAIYIPCGSWPAGPDVVEFLERDLGKPVITSHQAFIWAGLRALKIKEPVKGFGRLLKTL